MPRGNSDTHVNWAYRAPDMRVQNRFGGDAVQAALYQQDRLVILPVNARGTKGLVIATLDFANNFNGRTQYRCPRVIRLMNEETVRRGRASLTERWLHADTILNLGTMGSVVAADLIRRQPTLSGRGLIRELNRELRKLYRELLDEDGQPCPLLDPALHDGQHEAQIIQALSDRRAELATGYIGYGLLTSGWGKFTGVGDVRVALDGRILVGGTKRIDAEKDKLVDAIVEQTSSTDLYASFLREEIIRQVEPFGVSVEEVDQLLADLRQHRYVGSDLRQAVFRWREQAITRRQFAWQNTAGSPYSYGAIDGTRTPDDTVKEFGHPLRLGQRVDFYTDGVQPVGEEANGEDPAYGLTDPMYGEATLVRVAFGHNLSRPQVRNHLVLSA